MGELLWRGGLLRRAPAVQQSHQQTIQAISGRVSWWRFNEAPGAAVAIDEEGTQNAAYQGDVVFNQTPLPADTDNQEIRLNGTNAFVEVTHNAAYNLSAGTIAVWFQLDSVASNRTLLSKDTAGIAAGNFVLWYLPSLSRLRFQLEDGATVYHADGIALAINTPYCVVIQWGSGGMKMYLAAGGKLQQIGSNAYTGGISNVQNLRIGASQWQGTAADFLDGVMGDVIIWNRQLSSAELEVATRAQLEDIGTAPYDLIVQEASSFSDLVAWYRLDGSPIVDSRGNVGDGVITGGVSFTASSLPDTNVLGANFDGVTGYITIPDNASLHLAQCAIHFAVDIDALPAVGAARNIFVKDGQGAVDQDLTIGIFNDAVTGVDMRATFQVAATVQRVRFPGITTGRHWVTLNLGGGQPMELFVDAISSETNASATVGLDLSTRPLLLGAGDFGAGAVTFFDGRVKHVQVYDSRLTLAQIQKLSPTFGSGDILDFDPVLYWPLLDGSATDVSGNGLSGTITGTPAGSDPAGIDLGGVAHISIAHNTAFESDPGTPHVDVFSEPNVCLTVTVNNLVNNTAIASKCDNPAAFVNSWYAVAMADGSIRLVNRWMDHEAVLASPPGAITAGVAFTLVLGWGYDGAWATINGRMLHNGDKDNRHWYGWDHRVRNVRQLNNSTLRIGRVGPTGTLGDITVKDFAVFVAHTKNGGLTLSDAQALSGASGPAIDYPVWSASLQTVANGAPGVTVQAAIDARSAAGGGTVQLAAGGTYTWSTSVILKNNVRLDLNGATVTVSAQVQAGATPTISTVTDDGGNLNAGATSMTGANLAAGLAVGDVLVVLHNTGIESLWSGTSAELMSESFKIISKSGNTVNFDRPAVLSYPSGSRLGLRKWTPPLRNGAIVNGTIQGAITTPVYLKYFDHLMVKDVFVRQTSVTPNLMACRNDSGRMFWSPRGFKVRNVSELRPTTAGGSGFYCYAVNNWTTHHYLHYSEFAYIAVHAVETHTFNSWHAISHWGYNAIAEVDTKGINCECEYVGCRADSLDQDYVFDVHYTAMKVRWIDCTVDPNAAGGGGTGAGGVLCDGFRHEILRFRAGAGGKRNALGGQEALVGDYFRDILLQDTSTRSWFNNFSTSDYKDNTFVNCHKSGGNPSDPGGVNNLGGNTYIDVDQPHF